MLRNAIALALLCVLALSAEAGRPLVTDDAGIVEARACQLETWLQSEGGARTAWILPACNPGGNLEITLGAALPAGGHTPGQRSQLLQFKTLLWPGGETEWRTGLAFGLQRLDRGAVSHEAYAYLVASRAIAGDHTLLHLNLGALHRGATRAHALTWALALDRQVHERLWISLESFGENRARAHYQIAARHALVPERLQLDASLGGHFGGGARVLSLGLVLVTDPL